MKSNNWRDCLFLYRRRKSTPRKENSDVTSSTFDPLLCYAAFCAQYIVDLVEFCGGIPGKKLNPYIATEMEFTNVFLTRKHIMKIRFLTNAMGKIHLIYYYYLSLMKLAHFQQTGCLKQQPFNSKNSWIPPLEKRWFGGKTGIYSYKSMAFRPRKMFMNIPALNWRPQRPMYKLSNRPMTRFSSHLMPHAAIDVYISFLIYSK